MAIESSVLNANTGKTEKKPAWLQFSYQETTVLSAEDKAAVEAYLAENCSHLSRVREIGSKVHIYSAPEDLLSYMVSCSFSVHYLLDGRQPVSGYVRLELRKERSSPDSSDWTTKVAGFEGLEDFLSAR